MVRDFRFLDLLRPAFEAGGFLTEFLNGLRIDLEAEFLIEFVPECIYLRPRCKFFIYFIVSNPILTFCLLSRILRTRLLNSYVDCAVFSIECLFKRSLSVDLFLILILKLFWELPRSLDNLLLLRDLEVNLSLLITLSP